MKHLPSLCDMNVKFLWRKNYLKHTCLQHTAAVKLVLKMTLQQKRAVFQWFLLRSSANFIPKARYCCDSERYGNAADKTDDGDQLAEGREMDGRSHLQMILQKRSMKILNLWRSTNVNSNIFPMLNQTLWDVVTWSLVKCWLEKHGLHFCRTAISYISTIVLFHVFFKYIFFLAFEGCSAEGSHATLFLVDEMKGQNMLYGADNVILCSRPLAT